MRLYFILRNHLQRFLSCLFQLEDRLRQRREARKKRAEEEARLAAEEEAAEAERKKQEEVKKKAPMPPLVGFYFNFVVLFCPCISKGRIWCNMFSKYSWGPKTTLYMYLVGCCPISDLSG